jgi:pyruvate/2-oxoglutarate dehydrogenase complex dihydrolipoamide acyltransferase (E2) component
MTRQPYLFVVGQMHEAPVVRDGAVAVGSVLPVSVTVDHRMAVGIVANRFRQAFVASLEDVERVRAWLAEGHLERSTHEGGDRTE